MRPNTPFETELGVCRNCENIAAFLSTKFCSMCGGPFERLKVREVVESALQQNMKEKEE